MLGIVLSGQMRFTLRDREGVLHAGDAVLMGGEEGGSSEAPKGFRFITLLMPMTVVAPTGATLAIFWVAPFQRKPRRCNC